MSRVNDALTRGDQGEEKRSSLVFSNAHTPPGLAETNPVDLEAVERIACPHHLEDAKLVAGAERNVAMEKYRLLAHRLHQMRRRKSLKTLVVTSSIPREGKTVTATNLAMILARGSSRVLLVDGDLRQPSVHRTLEVPALPGLAEFLEEEQKLADSIRCLDPSGVYFLSAGHTSVSPVELLQGTRMRWLMHAAKTMFDWVVLDSPPLIPFADAHCLATLSDGVLLVVRSGMTPSENLRQTLNTLDGARVVGVVLNACDDRNQDSYYSYYQQSSVKRSGSSGPEEELGHLAESADS